MIPRVFHQVWLGPDPFPGRYERYQQTWLDHHPGWQLRFWTEDTLPDQLRRPEAAERLRSPAERADILRLEVVWRHGGVYLDPYFECLRPIDELIADTDLFAVQARSGRPTNTLFGATAQHPLLDQALDRIQPRAFPGYDETATGRRFFEHLLADQPTLTLLDSNLFYPRTTKKLEHAHATSHELRPWKSTKEVRQALLKSARRHQAAQEATREWRRRYEEAVGHVSERTQNEARPATPRTNRPLRIPRIFHQIWLGPHPLPEEFSEYRQTWLDHHPGWQLRFWTEENLPGDLRRPEGAQRLRNASERSDILRLEVVRLFGGVYVDTDFECLRSLEPLIEDAEFFIGLAKPDRVNGALFGAVADHPILGHALDEIQPREFYGYSLAATGPKFLDRLLAAHRDEVLFLEPGVLYGPKDNPADNAYGLHHSSRAWKDVDLYWRQMQRTQQRVEQKLARAREEASEWRARSKAAEAELDRLRRWRRAAIGRLSRRAKR